MLGLDTIVKKESPDFHFVILENERTRPDLKIVFYDSQNRRLRSHGEIGTILEMNELMNESFDIIAPLGVRSTENNLDGKYELFPNSSGLFLAPDYPDFLLPMENSVEYKAAPQVYSNVITWNIVRKEPGTAGGKPFSGTREIKARTRENVAVYSDYAKKYIIGDTRSDFEGYGSNYSFVRTHAQVFDNLVQYNIWSKSNYEVEKLTEWFEIYMDTYRGMFREAGINEMYFDTRFVDNKLSQSKNGYHSRSVIYYVRTERVRVEGLYPIKRIDVNDLKRLGESMDQITIEDKTLYDKILKKWHTRGQRVALVPTS
jgi:hypothetical protein